MRSSRQGLRVTPDTGLSAVSLYPDSQVVVLQVMIAPALRRDVTTAESTSGTKSSNTGAPPRAGTPATKIRSFTVTGIPASGPINPALRHALVAAFASMRAESNICVTITLQISSVSSSAPITSSMTSIGVKLPTR